MARVSSRRVTRHTGANRPRGGVAITTDGEVIKLGRRGGGRYGHVKKVPYDGMTFDSADECRRYQDLKLMQQACVIRDLKCQVRIPIIINGIPVKSYSERYKNGRQIKYVADFVYFDIEKGFEVYEDFKGHQTDVFILKRALMRAMGYTIFESRRAK